FVRYCNWNTNFAYLFSHILFLSTCISNIVPAKNYQKEMERITVLTKFDIGIDFVCYSPFCAALFAFVDLKRNSIYLHSDMDKELDKKVNDKHPHRKNLKAIFSLYDLFDKVISVSKSVHEQNRENIKQFIKHSRGKMDYV